MPIPAVSTFMPPLPKYLRDVELTKELKDFISSLPTEKGWLASHLHQYQGFWHHTSQLLAILSCQNHFMKPLDTDVLLVTNPKSGTTWLKAIIFSLVNRRLHPPTSQCHPLLTSNPHDLFPFLELQLYTDPNQAPDLSAFKSPRLFSTHMPLVSLPELAKAEDGCKLVYLCRNPRDTFVSLWHFTNNLKVQNMSPNPLEEVFDKFCRGASLFGPYWDHVLGYWKESLKRPHKVLFLKYEDMKEQPGVQLRRLADFLGYPFSPEEEASGVVHDVLNLCSFDNLSTLEVNKRGKQYAGQANNAFFRRGVVGDSRNYLTAEMTKRIDRITEEKFGGTGLKI